MPELPDLTVYVERLRELLAGHPLRRLQVHNAFVLRSAETPPEALHGRAPCDARRLGKRIVLDFGDHHFAVLHLMVAGRLQWRPAPAARGNGRGLLASFEFDDGRLLFTEAGTRRRASLHVVHGEHALAAFDRGGLEVLEHGYPEFAAALTRENHTLKRALTDPGILAGIGNAYSDEILHRARLSPFRQTRHLEEHEMRRLHEATVGVLGHWLARLRAETGQGFPAKVTAFREGMAVHGRYRQPCPACGAPVQRIVYAGGEANYCARCQTGGRLLADRALSRLLKANWPRTLEELESGAGAMPAGEDGERS